MTCCKEEYIEETSDIIDENLIAIAEELSKPRALQTRLVIGVQNCKNSCFVTENQRYIEC